MISWFWRIVDVRMKRSIDYRFLIVSRLFQYDSIRCVSALLKSAQEATEKPKMTFMLNRTAFPAKYALGSCSTHKILYLMSTTISNDSSRNNDATQKNNHFSIRTACRCVSNVSMCKQVKLIADIKRILRTKYN